MRLIGAAPIIDAINAIDQIAPKSDFLVKPEGDALIEIIHVNRDYVIKERGLDTESAPARPSRDRCEAIAFGHDPSAGTLVGGPNRY